MYTGVCVLKYINWGCSSYVFNEFVFNVAGKLLQLLYVYLMVRYRKKKQKKLEQTWLEEKYSPTFWWEIGSIFEEEILHLSLWYVDSLVKHKVE